jgi:dihydrofolate reductase
LPALSDEHWRARTLHQPHIFLIVAVAENSVIGQDGAVPWRLQSDVQRFRALTMGKPVVMGRKTFASLKRPLAGRTNIVMTRDLGFAAAGAVVATSLENARAVAWGDALRRSVGEIAVIGGAQIYPLWMDVANRLEVTEVHSSPAGSVRLAPIDPRDWLETARQRHAAEAGDSADFSYVTYRRRNPR